MQVTTAQQALAVLPYSFESTVELKNIHGMFYFILPPDTTKSNYMCLYAQHVLVSGFLGFYCGVVEISVLLRSEAISLFSDILTLEGETTTVN
jgi:hypothetical protein